MNIEDVVSSCITAINIHADLKFHDVKETDMVFCFGIKKCKLYGDYYKVNKEKTATTEAAERCQINVVSPYSHHGPM